MSDKAGERPFRGYIQVYTGTGKGKTTAALGLALRAAGHGLKTYIGQFLKGQEYGELRALAPLVEFITVEQFGRKGFIHVGRDPDQEDYDRARFGLEKCREALLSGSYNLVVLDEVCVALHFGLLSEADVLGFLDQKPGHVEVVLTGRFAPQAVLDRADLVTDMTALKHYYDRGVRARDGVER
jgi:cob(I)alamin adenosyltransferase